MSKPLSKRTLAHISHQAASNTDKALTLWDKTRMTRNTVCFSSEAITIQAGLRVPSPHFHQRRDDHAEIWMHKVF
jgi:hypothetical protein